MIRVDRGIPLPEGGRGSSAGATWRRESCTYPWHDLEVGDSFFTENDGIKHRLTQVGRLLGIRLISRKWVQDGVEGRRVWRAA